MATNNEFRNEWSLIAKCNPSNDMIDILVDGEEILQCYRTVRDMAALTNKRIIFKDKQGVTGKKTELFSLPYRSIEMWSSENTGVIDVTKELELWTRCGNFKITVAAKCDIREFDRILAEGII